MSSLEDREMEQDILKLQLHAIPLNLNPTFPNIESTDEDESDNDASKEYISSVKTSSHFGNNEQPSTSKAGLWENEEIADDSSLAVQSIDDESDEELIDLSADYEPTPLNLLKLNLAYQEVITQQLDKIKQLMQDNKLKQALIIEEQNRAAEAAQPIPQIMMGTFRQYLKDEKGFPPETNAEVERRKVECGEMFVPNPVPCKKWTKKAVDILRAAIEKNALRSLTEPLLSKMEYLQEKYRQSEDPLTHEKIKAVKKEIIKAKEKVPEAMADRFQEWDWDVISNIDLPDYPAQNCRLQWMNFLHPSINKKPWTIGETEKLKDVLKEHKDHNWTEVCKKMNGRTAMDCCRNYQLKISTTLRRAAWTPEEDENLIKLIHQHRVGQVIPYTLIACKLGGRTCAQLVHRWTKTLDPTFKHSKWTADEDAKLIKAVLKYGTKWSYIRDLGIVPGRNDSQLRERYINCLRSGTYGSWTEAEDQRLLELLKKTKSWSAVAKEFKGRSDQQCLKRWRIIESARKKGVQVLHSSPGQTVHYRELRDLREKLAASICAEEMSVKIENPDLAGSPGDGEIYEDPTTRQRHLIKITPRSSESTANYSDIDRLDQLSSTMSSADVIKVYNQLLSVKSRSQLKEERRLQNPDVVKIDKKIFNLIDDRFQPMKVRARDPDGPISAHRKILAEASEDLTAKVLFGHFVKALNINAQNALDAIKRKKKIKTKTAKLKDLLDQSAVKQEAQALSDVKQFMTGRPNKDDVTKSSAAKSKSRVFARNLYLPLCAPNRATTQAYRNLLAAREKRIDVAKTILVESEVTEPKSASSKNDEAPSHDVGTTSAADDVQARVALGEAEPKGNDVSEADPKGNDVSGADPKGNDVSGADPKGNDVSGADPKGNGVSEADPKGNDVDGSQENGDDVTKYDTEEILAHIRKTTKYKVLRSRFNALFTWPTLLASLVPYCKSNRAGNFVPAVRLKRPAASPPEGAVVHKKSKT